MGDMANPGVDGLASNHITIQPNGKLAWSHRHMARYAVEGSLIICCLRSLSRTSGLHSRARRGSWGSGEAASSSLAVVLAAILAAMLA